MMCFGWSVHYCSNMISYDLWGWFLLTFQFFLIPKWIRKSEIILICCCHVRIKVPTQPIYLSSVLTSYTLRYSTHFGCFGSCCTLSQNSTWFPVFLGCWSKVLELAAESLHKLELAIKLWANVCSWVNQSMLETSDCKFLIGIDLKTG